MLFTSDNWAGVHPDIMAAIVRANGEPVPAYGADPMSEGTQELFSAVFDRPVQPAYVATGSAANSLALACLTPPWGAVLCHQDSHIHLDEAAAPEFFTGGAKIVPLKGVHGKLTPSIIDDAMAFFTPPQAHHVVPAVLSLTQATECGTVYTVDELRRLVDCAKKHGLKTHMDGARYANAVASLGVGAADLSAKLGIDVLTLGGTKNGCMLAEAILFFDETYRDELTHRQKRAGQSMSKARFLSAQWTAYFRDDRWLSIARHANEMASRLSKGLATVKECRIVHPTEINEVFVTIPDSLAEQLRQAGAMFYDWNQPDDPYDRTLRRLVTSFSTTPAQVEAFLETLQKAAQF